MLQPKNTKFRKMHRGRLSGKPTTNKKLVFGDIGLQALESSWITGAQIEAARKVISRYTKRTGKVWIKIFPDKSVTERPVDSRMGSGKGNVKEWVAIIKSGQLIFELLGVDKEISKKALTQASYKLPIKTKIITKEITNA